MQFGMLITWIWKRRNIVTMERIIFSPTDCYLTIRTLRRAFVAIKHTYRFNNYCAEYFVIIESKFCSFLDFHNTWITMITNQYIVFSCLACLSYSVKSNGMPYQGKVSYLESAKIMIYIIIARKNKQHFCHRLKYTYLTTTYLFILSRYSNVRYCGSVLWYNKFRFYPHCCSIKVIVCYVCAISTLLTLSSC